MCILCVASRWSRRIVTMLPWLIIPLLLLWALSQLLPPGFRFEVTAPRLACVGVLLFSLGWYELLMPRLSEWRARRSLLLHERRKIEAQEAAKWRKEAIRKCRNCFMAYKEQKPAGGKFMCTFCGHLSKRPALDVPGGGGGGAGGNAGFGHFICRKDLRMQEGNKSWSQRMFENELWPGVWGGGGEGCYVGGQSSGVVIVFRLVSFLGCCLWLACSRLWKRGMSEGSTERKAGGKKGDGGGGGGGGESKAERVKRKAEEKRLARLEKEQMEAEERMQREEVARLVDERRRQRADALKDSESVEEYEPQRRSTDKGKDPGKLKGFGEEDCRKSKARKDRKVEDGSKVAKVAETKNEGSPVGKGAPVTKTPSTNLLASVKPSAGVYPKHPQIKTSSFLTLKKEKPSLSSTPASAPVSKVNPNENSPVVVSKPSAWNRISWAWGKGGAARISPMSLEPESNNKEFDPSLIPSPILNSPILSPSKITSSPNKPVEMPPVIDLRLSTPPSSEDHLSPAPVPVSTPTSPLIPDKETAPPSIVKPSSYESSVSVYSTFMPPADTFPVSAPPAASDNWGSDFSKSTWKMWEAPNLELPRLTQSLAKDGRSLHPPVASSELVSSVTGLNPGGGAAAAQAKLPGGLPISNNIWSNYHAFESTRRIWEGDLPSEAPPPPEFVDCITQELMQDPVIAADGHSYERSAIEAWLKTHDTSPKTGGVLPPLGSSGSGVDKSLRPNHNLRGQIIEYKECIQRGVPPPSNVWQASTEAVKKSRVASLYSSPVGGSVWSYSSSCT